MIVGFRFITSYHSYIRIPFYMKHLVEKVSFTHLYNAVIKLTYH